MLLGQISKRRHRLVDLRLTLLRVLDGADGLDQSDDFRRRIRIGFQSRIPCFRRGQIRFILHERFLLGGQRVVSRTCRVDLGFAFVSVFHRADGVDQGLNFRYFLCRVVSGFAIFIDLAAIAGIVGFVRDILAVSVFVRRRDGRGECEVDVSDIATPVEERTIFARLGGSADFVELLAHEIAVSDGGQFSQTVGSNFGIAGESRHLGAAVADQIGRRGNGQTKAAHVVSVRATFDAGSRHNGTRGVANVVPTMGMGNRRCEDHLFEAAHILPCGADGNIRLARRSCRVCPADTGDGVNQCLLFV